MSTANFYIKNAYGYYIVSDHDGDDTKTVLENIQENGKWDGWDVVNKWNRPGGWDEKTILSRSHMVYVVSGFCQSMEIEIVFRPGYYASGVLDWDLHVDWYIGSLTDYKDEDEFADAIVESARLDLLDQGWNDGLWAIHKGRIREAIQKGIRDAIERAEDFCKSNSVAKLRCLGVASNGEAFYERA